MATRYTPEFMDSDGGQSANPFVELVRNPDGSWTIQGLPGGGGSGAPSGVPGAPDPVGGQPPAGPVPPTGGGSNPAGKGLLDSILNRLQNPYIAAILGGALEGLFSDEGGQQRTPFTGDLAPDKMLGRFNDNLNEVYPKARRRLGGDINLPSAFAQQPPTFMGGGLPMPIGVTGVDPALSNPDLLSLPGLDSDEDDSGEAAAAISILRGRR
jgi:hypothetical protein